MKEEEAVVSAFDHGFLYGIGMFETFAVRQNGVFLLDRHINRLEKSLEAVGVDYKLNKEEVYKVTNVLLKKNGLSEGYVRWNVSAGVRSVGLFKESYTNPQVVVYMKTLPSPPIEKKAISLSLPRNSPEGYERYKSHHYMNNVLAKQELDDPNAEGIFYTKDGYVAEGIVSNLFWRKNNCLYTPSLETGILNGVTRRYVIQLLNELGYELKEGLFTKDDLNEAEEMFVTNAIQGVVPVSSVDQYTMMKQDVASLVAQTYKQRVLERRESE